MLTGQRAKDTEIITKYFESNRSGQTEECLSAVGGHHVPESNRTGVEKKLVLPIWQSF